MRHAWNYPYPSTSPDKCKRCGVSRSWDVPTCRFVYRDAYGAEMKRPGQCSAKPPLTPVEMGRIVYEGACSDWVGSGLDIPSRARGDALPWECLTSNMKRPWIAAATALAKALGSKP